MFLIFKSDLVMLLPEPIKINKQNAAKNLVCVLIIAFYVFHCSMFQTVPLVTTYRYKSRNKYL